MDPHPPAPFPFIWQGGQSSLLCGRRTAAFYSPPQIFGGGGQGRGLNFVEIKWYKIKKRQMRNISYLSEAAESQNENGQ